MLLFTRSTCCSIVDRIALGEGAAFVSFIHCAFALRQGKASGGLAAAEVDATAQPALEVPFSSTSRRARIFLIFLLGSLLHSACRSPSSHLDERLGRCAFSCQRENTSHIKYIESCNAH